MDTVSKKRKKISPAPVKSTRSTRAIRREVERGVTTYLEKGSKFIQEISRLKTIEEFNLLLNSTFKTGDEQTLKGDVLEIFVNWILNNANDVFDFSVLNGIKRSILHNQGVDPNETEDDQTLREEILDKFNLPAADEGIDGYFSTADGKLGAYQCKVRTAKKTLTINDDKLGTFYKLTSDTPHKLANPGLGRAVDAKFDFVVVISTAESVPEDYNNTDDIWILKEDFAKFIHDFTEAFGESPFVQFALYYEKNYEKDLLNYSGETYVLKPHQGNHKKSAIQHFIQEGNHLGIMISPTGTGKTRMIFETIFEVFPSGVHILAAPWISLLYQNLEDFLKYAKARGKEFDAAISYSSSENDRALRNNGICRLRNEEEVAVWLNDRDRNKISILFTTYASGEKLIDGVNLLSSHDKNFEFSSLTCDESHRTVGQRDSLWTKLVIPGAIPVKHKMFATATIREIGDMRKQLEKEGIDAIGMDDKKFFGDIFYNLTFKDAIKQKLICDFEIVVATETPEEIIKLRKKIHLNGELITSDPLDSRQLIGLGITQQLMKAGEIKKAIFFSSDNTRSARAHSGAESLFAPSLCSKDSVLFTSSHESSKGNKIDTIKAFGNAEMALLFNCQQIKEGIDVKSCDCIVFLDPKTSKIDITQAIGRALRIDSKNPDKIAKVILPVVAEFDENEKCVINDESFKHLQNFLTSIVDLDEEIRESFDLLIEEVKGSKKSKPQKKGKLRFSKFDIFDYENLEKIRIRILKSTGEVLWYSVEKIHEEIKNDPRVTSFKAYDELVESGSEFRPDYFMFRKYQNISREDYYKKIGYKKFLGMEKALRLQEKLYHGISNIIKDCEIGGFSRGWASKRIYDFILPHFPFVKRELEKEGGQRKRGLAPNPLYKHSQTKGLPLSKTASNFLSAFEKDVEKPYRNLKVYCTEEDFKSTILKYSIKTRKEYFELYKGELYEEFLKLGMPGQSAISSNSVFSSKFIDSILERDRSYYAGTVSEEVLKNIYVNLKEQAESGNWRGSGGYKKAADDLGMPVSSIKLLLSELGFPEISHKKTDNIDHFLVKEKLESGAYSYFTLAKEMKCKSRELIKVVEKARKAGIEINYTEEDNTGTFKHSCGKEVKQRNNARQHSSKCGCTFIKIH